MDFDVRKPGSGDQITADERSNLITEGFDLDEKWPEYGNGSLVEAYRAGYHDAPGVAAELRRQAEELRRESLACSQLDARGMLRAAERLIRRAAELDPQGGAR